MCGIVSWFTRAEKIDEAILEHARDKIYHRGPDASGIYISEDKQAGMGFRRLSIIDLSSDGNQPMSNEDGTVWLVFNGEIYNYQEIRSLLMSRGYKFSSNTDSEVVLHSYEEWGMACVERFLGMFAFVIWDARKKCVFAARDRVGIKPLYYALTPNQLLLASELKAITDFPGFSKEIDQVSIYD